jgi:hypothetical protein
MCLRRVRMEQAAMDFKYTFGHGYQNGPTLCFECDDWIDAGDAISVLIESLTEDEQPVTGFLHKNCARKVGLETEVNFAA